MNCSQRRSESACWPCSRADASLRALTRTPNGSKVSYSSWDRDSTRRSLSGLLLPTKGLGATTVSDIAGKARVAKGSFYPEFPSKEHLVVVLKQRYADELLENASAIAARLGTEDLWTLTEEFIEAMVDF